MATKSFDVICPFCGDSEANIKIDLNALGSITCGACDEEYTAKVAVAKAAGQLKRWEAVARWVEMAGTAFAAGADV